MTRQAIIERAIKAINWLPEDKAKEISDFAGFVIKKHEESLLKTGTKQLAIECKSFDFLTKRNNFIL